MDIVKMLLLYLLLKKQMMMRLCFYLLYNTHLIINIIQIQHVIDILYLILLTASTNSC